MMRDVITFQDLQDSVAWLQHDFGHDEYGNALTLQLPYRLFPGSYPGGIQPLITRVRWETYGWNPPGYMPDLTESQPGVSGKPIWKMVVAAIEPGWIMRNRPIILADLDRECRRRITAGYGKSSVETEGFFRLRAMEAGAVPADKARLVAGNTARERLRARHDTLRTWVNSLTTRDVLSTINWPDDTYWSEDYAPPE